MGIPKYKTKLKKYTNGLKNKINFSKDGPQFLYMGITRNN